MDLDDEPLCENCTAQIEDMLDSVWSRQNAELTLSVVQLISGMSKSLPVLGEDRSQCEAAAAQRLIGSIASVLLGLMVREATSKADRIAMLDFIHARTLKLLHSYENDTNKLRKGGFEDAFGKTVQGVQDSGRPKNKSGWAS